MTHILGNAVTPLQPLFYGHCIGVTKGLQGRYSRYILSLLGLDVAPNCINLAI
jgi:hypothetical protein